MKDFPKDHLLLWSRRTAVRIGLLPAFASFQPARVEASAAPCSGLTQLAGNHSVVAKISPKDYFFHDPGMALLPSGAILVAAPCWHLNGGDRSLVLARSRDGGHTWERLSSLPFADATPFVVNGRLYMFVQPQNWKDVYFTLSDDEGRTWASPVKIFEGSYWNCCTGMVVANNRLYWALDADNWAAVVAISADLSKDLLTRSAWRMSNPVQRPPTPQLLTRSLYPPAKAVWSHQWKSDAWLEPNVVNVNGSIRVILRMIIDEYATANLAAVCDLTDDGNHLDLRFAQFYPFPGGQNKFFILYDRVSRLYWMLSNLVTDSQDTQHRHDALEKAGFLGGPGNERRILALSYSLDATNWFSAGIASRWNGMLQSYMYPAAAIDGNDIIYTSRTSEYARNQHDADRVTFHRISNFRPLAMDLHTSAGDFVRKT